MNPVATIGYETSTLDDVIGRLKSAEVELVVDVRAVASSRRAGFSKTLLAGSLDEAGIDYLHLRDLGTPKAGRQAARAGHTSQMHAIYAQHMDTPEAQAALHEAMSLAGRRRICLLCYEQDPAQCHRTLVAGAIAEATGAKIVDL